MIFGDPYKFAVMFDRVNEWNLSDYDDNGHFALCIDGQMIPDHLINAVVSTSLNDVVRVLKNIPGNQELFLKEKEQLIESLYDITYPPGLECDNDYRYIISPAAITDESCFVFGVRNNDMVRITGCSELGYDTEESHHIFENADIYEVIMNESDLDDIIAQIEKYMR